MSKTNEKKGVLSAIWESMTKTGGCCGGGKSCGCDSKPDKTKIEKKNGNASSSRGANSGEGRKG